MSTWMLISAMLNVFGAAMTAALAVSLPAGFLVWFGGMFVLCMLYRPAELAATPRRAEAALPVPAPPPSVGDLIFASHVVTVPAESLPSGWTRVAMAVPALDTLHTYRVERTGGPGNYILRPEGETK